MTTLKKKAKTKPKQKVKRKDAAQTKELNHPCFRVIFTKRDKKVRVVQTKDLKKSHLVLIE